jgi:hypothetical protein
MPDRERAAKMRRRLFFAFGLVSVLWSGTVSAQPSNAGRFDGRWDVTLVCPKSPDGALPFTFAFTADVKGAMLHGENGVAGRPRWMSLDGPIHSNGAATLDARGLTGHAQDNVGQTDRGVPYRHIVTAQFGSARGTGTWAAVRICDFTFTRK